MKTSKQLFAALVAQFGPLVMAVSITACGNLAVPNLKAPQTEAALSYQAFKAQAFGETFHGVPTGIYIVDGDTPANGEDRLLAYYQQYLNSYRSSNTHEAAGYSIVATSGGISRVWNETEKLQLTYCISNAFALKKPLVAQAMADATAAWQTSAIVQFIHVATEDAACSVTNTNVLFDIELTAGQSYLARSFFPGDLRSTRSLMIDASSFSVGYPLTLTGILRHELGHTLGLRHEHTRPEAGKCFEDNNWLILTTYDAASVMHYPQCNGTGDWSLMLTSLDVQGIGLIYGTPLAEIIPEPLPAP